MATLTHKTLLYDGACPMCQAYSQGFVKLGTLTPQGRVSLMGADQATLAKVDINRARHEIPLVDTQTGEVLYGVDALAFVIGNMVPALATLSTKAWAKVPFRPLYNFISYNRRVIAGTGNSPCGNDFAPDFHLGWRMALIVGGIGYTGLCIYLFCRIVGIADVFQVFAFVFAYFMLLFTGNLFSAHTPQQKWDYLGHLGVLGIIEGSLFVLTALATRSSNMIGLLFAGQGAGRLLALYLHAQRVKANGYNPRLNIAFAVGAFMLVVYLAYIIR